ncbi:hypothetical protein Droror1_Dr00013078 [Drosera rotundifolia]
MLLFQLVLEIDNKNGEGATGSVTSVFHFHTNPLERLRLSLDVSCRAAAAVSSATERVQFVGKFESLAVIPAGNLLGVDKLTGDWAAVRDISVTVWLRRKARLGLGIRGQGVVEEKPERGGRGEQSSRRRGGGERVRG